MHQDEQSGSTEAGQAVGADRRTAERFPCDFEPLCREQASGRGEWQALRVENISATGIGLVTPYRLRPGTILVLRLISRTRGVTRPTVVRIMHCTAQENAWLIGAMFVRRLTTEALQELLDNGPTPGPAPSDEG
jgi:hypothetical protein